MPVLRINNGAVRLNYQEARGAPPALVLLHGFPFTSDLWRPQTEALAPRHRVVAPDLPGFGDSEAAPGPLTMARLADDVAELLDALELQSAVIAGLSMGGYVAFEFYRRHPARAVALILADTRPQPDSPQARTDRAAMARLARQEGARAVAERLMPKLLGPLTRAEKPEIERELREMMESVRPETIEAALAAMAKRADSRPLLPDIEVPVLVLTGAQDSIAPPSETREWASRIPDARVKVIEGAGHVSNLEQPGAFNEAVLDFLARLAGRGGATLSDAP